MIVRRYLTLVGFVSAAILTACGGGGSATSSSVMPSVSVSTPTPVSTTPTQSITGNLVEYVSGVPLGAFTVTVGTLPNRSTCNGAQTQTLNACGQPALVMGTTTTGPDGTFTLTGVAAGTYMLTVGKDTTYATLHRSLTVSSGTTTVGAMKITALSSDEQAWLKDMNNQRSTVSVPTSFGNLAVDEYAEEQARQWSSDIVSGKTVPGDPGLTPYEDAYRASTGSIYAITHVGDLIGSPSGYILADMAWMNEKANCPNGNWETCVFAPNTGHYKDVSNVIDVWVGLGESSTSFLFGTFGSEWAYDALIIENYIP